MFINFENEEIEPKLAHLQKWYFHRPRLAKDTLINEFLNINTKAKKFKGSVGGSNKVDDKVLKIRNVDLTVVPLEPYKNLYESTVRLVRKLNKEFFGFDISRLEKINLLNYTEGQFYVPHIDTSFDELLCRKLTLIIGLSNKEDYEGGDLVILPNGASPVKIKLDKGDVLLFPSFILHEVTPVTSGHRITAVSWVWGKKFK